MIWVLCRLNFRGSFERKQTNVIEFSRARTLAWGSKLYLKVLDNHGFISDKIGMTTGPGSATSNCTYRILLAFLYKFLQFLSVF